MSIDDWKELGTSYYHGGIATVRDTCLALGNTFGGYHGPEDMSFGEIYSATKDFATQFKQSTDHWMASSPYAGRDLYQFGRAAGNYSADFALGFLLPPMKFPALSTAAKVGKKLTNLVKHAHLEQTLLKTKAVTGKIFRSCASGTHSGKIRKIRPPAQPSGQFYSVAFETNLSEVSYPGVSRARHFQEANSALLNSMEKNAQFSQIIRQLGINLERTPTGLAPRTPPAGWTWHHAKEAGVMQLVPRNQHTPGSIFWDILHPGGQGGYSIWGQ